MLGEVWMRYVFSRALNANFNNEPGDVHWLPASGVESCVDLSEAPLSDLYITSRLPQCEIYSVVTGAYSDGVRCLRRYTGMRCYRDKTLQVVPLTRCQHEKTASINTSHRIGHSWPLNSG